jgi:hypothetical protein
MTSAEIGPNRFLRFVGGRKQLNGYLYAILVSLAAWFLNADFQDYATWLAVALLGTSAIVAFEDVNRGDE